jgi:hypothetical protein
VPRGKYLEVGDKYRVGRERVIFESCWIQFSLILLILARQLVLGVVGVALTCTNSQKISPYSIIHEASETYCVP